LFSSSSLGGFGWRELLVFLFLSHNIYKKRRGLGLFFFKRNSNHSCRHQFRLGEKYRNDS
jgi:hypothetical protein